MNKGILYRALAASALTAITGGPVWAQQAELTPSASQPDNGPQIEDIIVQARRSEERQQSVPLAISTITDEALKQNAASSIADIKRLVPSLQITLGPSGQQDFTIRGSFAALGVDPSVATYIDDIPINSQTLVYALYDLASVQEVKGPQGTLFGRNTTGGAVLFYSKKPSTDGIGGYANARYGNYKGRRFEGAVNVPLGDTLAFRLSGELERRDGLLKSALVPRLDYQNRHNSAIRGALLWTPTSDIENYTQFTHYRVREHRYPQVLTSLAGPCTGPTTPAASCLYQPPFNGFLGLGNVRDYLNQQNALPANRTVATDPTRDDIDRDSITNSFTLALGGVSFRNISYYGDTNIGFSRDFDGTPVDVLSLASDNHTKTFYSESQIYGKLANDRLDWRVGFVFSNDKAYASQVQELFQTPFSTTSPKTTISATKFKSTALFGQATYDMSDFLKGVSITAGYRYTWDDRRIATQVYQGIAQVCGLQTLPVPATGPAPFPNTDLATCTRKLHSKFNDYNYNFTLDWKPTDKVLLYAATRRGYKTGSFNIFEPNPDLAEYQPEVVKDIEVGLKADWRIGGVPFRTNIAAYRSKYTNIQSQTVTINQSTGDIKIIVLNADPATGLATKATIKGIEAEMTVAPAKWLEIKGFYSKLRAKYTQFIFPGGLNLAGQNVANNIVPETYGASAQINIPLAGPIEAIDLNGSYYHYARGLSNVTSTTISPAQTSVDARIALRNLWGSGADVAAFGKNLTNNVYKTTNPVFAGATTIQRSDPRFYGIELTYRFGSDR